MFDQFQDIEKDDFLEPPNQFDDKIVNPLLQSENFINDFLTVAENMNHEIHVLPTGALILLMDKLDKCLEQTIKSQQDTLQILKLILKLMDYQYYITIFYSINHLLAIIEQSNSLQDYEFVTRILIKVISHRNLSSKCRNQIRENFLRITYLSKILNNHQNTFSSNQIDVGDLFSNDNWIQNSDTKLVFEQINSQLYSKTYEQIKQKTLSNEVNPQVSADTLEILDDGQSSAYELVKKQLTNYQGSSPLLDAIKYKILIIRGLNQNKNNTIAQIVILSLLSDQLIYILNRLQFIVIEYFQLLKELLVKTNYQNLLDTCLILIIKQREQIDMCIIVIDIINFIFRQNKIQQKEKYEEKFLLIINDILSSNPHSQQLSQLCIKNEQIASRLLNLFVLNSNERGFLNSSNIIIGSSQALVQTLMIKNNLLPLQIKVLKSAIQLLGQLSLQSENDYIFDDLLKIIENFLSISNIQKPIDDGHQQINIEELDLILSCCLQTLNENFKVEQQNNNQVQRERNARKIIGTQILLKLKKILSLEFNQTFKETLLLVSNIANQMPNLIGRLIDSQLPKILNNLIQQFDFQQQTNYELVVTIIKFYQNITFNEEGQSLFNQFAFQFVRKSLKYSLIQSYPQRMHIASFGINFKKYLETNPQQMSDILIDILDELYNFLKEKQLSLPGDNSSNDYNEILNKLVVLSRFMRNIINMSIDEELADRFFNVLIKFTEFPLFSHRKIIICFLQKNFLNLNIIIQKLLESINQWETSLGFLLDESQGSIDEKYFNQDVFFNNQKLRECFEQVSIHQRIEYLLLLLDKNLNFQIIQQNKQVLQNMNLLFQKCCSLYNFQRKFQQQNGEVDFIKRLDFPLLLTLRMLISFLFNLPDIELSPLCNLLQQFSLSLEIGNLKNINFTCALILGLIRTNFEGKKKTDFLLQLLPSVFMKNLKLGLHYFLQNFQQDSNNNEAYSDITNKYIAMFQCILQINKNEINLKITQCYQLLILKINEIEAFLQILIEFKNLPLVKSGFNFILNQIRILCSQNLFETNTRNFQAFFDQRERQFFQSQGERIQAQALQMGYQRQDINMALQNIEFPNLQNVLDWIEFNKQQINEQQLEQQTNQTIQLKEQINERINKLKQFLKQNIIHFHSFEQQVFQIIEENMLPSLLQCLRQAVQKQFQIQLNIEECQSEIALPTNITVQTISTILCYIQLTKEIINRFDILPELIKLIKLLYESTDDKQVLVMSVQKILQIIQSLLNNNQNYQNTYDDDVFTAIIMIFQSETYNHIITEIIIRILINIFSLSRENIRKFVIQMKGLEYLFSLKVDNVYQNHSEQLLKLAVMIIHDKSILIAQIEAKIKRILYDEEYNKTIERINNESQNQRRNRLSNYPISPHPIQYDIPIPQVIQIASNHPSLLYLQQQTQCQELLKEVMSNLFDEGETIDNVQYLILKSGIQLDTLDCVSLNSFQKYSQSENQMNQRIYKQKLQSNFYHTQESQILLEQMIQQIIRSYYGKEQKYLYDWSTLFEVLFILIRRYPLLIPKLMSINCAQWFNTYHQKQLGQNNSGLQNKISFITLKTRLIKESKLPLFELCLDNVLLFKTTNNQIIPFSHLIRMKTLSELYTEIQKNIQTFNISEDADTLIRILQITSVAKMCYPNSHDQQGFNFTKLYMDAFKRFDLKTYYNNKQELISLTEIITLLNNVAIQLQFYKPKKLPVMPLQGQNVNQIQNLKIIGQLLPIEINAQLIPNHTIQSFNPYPHFVNWPQKPAFFKDEFRNFMNNFLPYRHLQVAQIKEINRYIESNQNFQSICIQQIETVEEEQEREIKQSINNQTDINQLFDDENDLIDTQQIESIVENCKSLDNFGIVNDVINLNFRQMETEIKKLEGLEFPYQFLEILVRFRRLLFQQTQLSRINLINPNGIQNNFQQLQQNFPQQQNLNHQLSIQQGRLGQFNHQLNQQANQNGLPVQEMQLTGNQFVQNILFEEMFQHENGTRNRQQTEQNQTKQYQSKKINFIYNQWNVENNFFEKLLSLLYVESESFVDFPVNLFILLINNLNIKNKLIDLLIFILFRKQSEQIDLPNVLITKNGMIKNQNTIHSIVSLKVLYLLSKLKGPQLDYFIQHQNFLQDLISNLLIFKDQHNELLLKIIRNITIQIKQQQIQIELDKNSIKNLCLYSVECNNRNIKAYSEIIHNLSSNSENVKLKFITFIQDFIYDIIHESNRGFINNLKFPEIFKTEKKLLNVIQLLKEILDKIEDENTLGKFVAIMKQQELLQFWQNLVRMLSQISIQEFTNFNNIISPYVECFFIIYSLINPNQEQTTQSVRVQSMETYINQQEYDDYEKLFSEIRQNGKRFLNIMMKDYITRNDTTNLCSFQVLMKKDPKIFDFEIKKKQFYVNLYQKNVRLNQPSNKLKIDRKYIFEDSFRYLSQLTQEQLKQKINIQFINEQGIDAGGPLRDWFTQVSREIANPVYHLFKPSEINHQYQPDPNSSQNPNHLKYFKFIGRFIGKALYDEQQIDIYFTRSFYKNIIGKKLTLEDLESVDQALYNKFVQMDNENIEGWNLYFTYSIDNNGVNEDRDLIEGGSNIQVTEDNKRQYIKAYCNQRMAREIEQQIKAFLEGFYEVIPKETVKLLDWTDLELLLCGEKYIDIEDMRKNTNYQGFNENDQVIKWLWELLESFDQSKRTEFLQFITGSSRVPVGGFSQLKNIGQQNKIIIRNKNSQSPNDDYPASHTCFYTLDLPNYSSRSILQERLEITINIGNHGFDMA